eukprot:6368464-Pyramimonas_sp.AAC.2
MSWLGTLLPRATRYTLESVTSMPGETFTLSLPNSDQLAVTTPANMEWRLGTPPTSVSRETLYIYIY